VLLPSYAGESLPHNNYKEERVGTGEEAMRIIRDFSPDVIACHSPAPSTLPWEVARVSAKNVRLVVWIHGYEGLYTGLSGYQTPLKTIPSLARDFIRLMKLRKILESVDAVIFVSDWLKRIVKKNTKARMKRVAVIPNPINTKLFVPRTKKPDKKFHIISVKGLNHQYGLDLAIKALKGLPDTDLTIIGDGPLLSRYKSLAAKLDVSVTFISPIYTHAEMASLYPKYDIYLAASRTETQGVAMCEAMSCGIPPVAARVGGIPEFIDDRLSGVLVRPNSFRALREGILELKRQPEKISGIGMAARQKIISKCDESVIIQEELALLQEKA
jgi:glycosyltransferase involved in cell wall biosynthesis